MSTKENEPQNDYVKSLYDSSIEPKIATMLKKYINAEYYTFSDHVTLPKIFKNIENTNAYKAFAQNYEPFLMSIEPTVNELIRKRIQWFDLQRRINIVEYDFVVYEKKSYYPILFIEINGQTHLEKKQKIIDKFKRSLSEEYDIPMISLELFNSEDDFEIEQALKRELKNKTHFRNCPKYCYKCKQRMIEKKITSMNSTKIEYEYQCPNNCKNKNSQDIHVTKEYFKFPFNLKPDTDAESAITVRKYIYLLEGKYYCGNSKCKGTPFISLGIKDSEEPNKISVYEIDVSKANKDKKKQIQFIKEALPQEIWEYIDKNYLQQKYIPTFYQNLFDCNHCKQQVTAPTSIYKNIVDFTGTPHSLPKKRGLFNIPKSETPKPYSELRVMAYPLSEELKLDENWIKDQDIVYPLDKMVILESADGICYNDISQK